MVFEVAIGQSRAWDPQKAGEEVVTSALEKMKHPPKIFLLFSTIHFDKERRGMQKFVRSAHNKLPRETQMIGGTIAGFINNYGSFTRGATGLAIYSDEMDIGVGVGRNTKRNPKKSAEKCAKEIKSLLRNSKYKNKVLVDLIAGPVVPTFPGVGQTRVLKGTLAKLAVPLLTLSMKVFQKGFGRENEVLKELAQQFQDFSIIGGATIDNNALQKNYQFYASKILENSVICLGIQSQIKAELVTGHGLTPAGIKFKVTKKALWNYVISEIDGKPATSRLIELLGWPEKLLDERLYRRTFYYPLISKDEQGNQYPNVIGAFLGNHIACGFPIESDDVEIRCTSGKRLISTVKIAMESSKTKKPKLGFGVSCAARLETLGMQIFKVYAVLKNHFGETPFLVVYMGGEDLRIVGNKQFHLNETFNMSIWAE
ncbi:MAG: FIST N-terminal domain-containing protein [archaeon]